tara:strand:+ start:8645 stop:9685 length:1041 start_codon:yes stop_codon:yes gene_type:complete
MGFTNQERINTNTNALQASVLDSNPASQWYEKRFSFEFALPSTKVYTQASSIPSANNLATARTNAVNNPTIIEDLSQNADAVRLTAVAGTNDFTFVAYQTYNDPSSNRIDNWLQPQFVPQSSGLPSFGYAVSLYDGDPASGGTLITTTDGQTGSGVNASVGWIWNYTIGMLLIAQDFFTQTGINQSTFNPHVVGFRYIGQTASGGASSTTNLVQSTDKVADETVATGDLVRVVQTGETGLTIGRIVKAIATNNKSEELYIALSGANQGDNVKIAIVGETSVKFSVAPTSNENGKKVYLSSTSGIATLTPPTANGTIVVKLGTLTGANNSDTLVQVLFRPQFVIEIG